jgi:glycosyltransferase involved in cell wall biosynthesis
VSAVPALARAPRSPARPHTAPPAAEQPGPTLGDFGIVYFGNDWYAENRTSSHHVAVRLARRAPLLYVESPGLRAPKASGRDIKKLVRKLRKAFERPTAIGENMWHISMPQIPFRRIPAVSELNRRLGVFLVRRALKTLGVRKRLSWFAVPHPGVLARAFDEEMVVYYCIDDYAALPDVDSEMVARMDRDLMQTADQVFVASALLLESKKAMNASAVHAPHGVDVSMFGTVNDPALPPADATRELKRPIIGFYGLIESWIDLDLIQFLAEQRPAWTFLLVGRLAVDAGRLRDLPNVVFAGPQPYAELPRWAKAFDVAIIPYRPTRQVLNSNPLKLREYLATGKPVVSFSAPEIDKFADVVRIARSPAQFLKHIEDALASDTDADRSRRLAAVAGMSWDARIDDVVRTVETTLSRKARQL